MIFLACSPTAVDFCRVIRDLGIYGPAQIWYEILTMNGTNGTKIQNGVHFQQNFGSIHFDDLQRQAGLSLNPIADNVPEFEQHYIIHLFNVTGAKTISNFVIK